MKRTVVSLVALAAMLGGCATVPPVLEVSLPEAQSGDVSTQVDWWRGFNDPELNRLIGEALAANADIRIALARLDQARALAGEARSGLMPQAGVSNDAAREREGVNALGPLGELSDPEDPTPLLRPTTTNRVSGRLEASWEIDLFGARRAALAAARAGVDAQESELGAVAVTVAGETADAYVIFRLTERRIELALQGIAALERTVSLVRRQVEFGAAPTTEIARAESALFAEQAALAELVVERERAASRIAVLTGQPPGATPLSAGPVPTLDREPAIAFPAQALRARPDVRAAEQQLRAASAEIVVARAELYPRLVLIGGAGGESTSAQNVFAPGSLFWSIGPRIELNLFSGGRVQARIRGAEARARELEAQFDKTVLTALQEVSDGYSAWSQASVSAGALQSSAEAAQRAADGIERRFALGAEDALSNLLARREALAAADAAVTAQANAARSLIALFRATAGAPLLNTDRLEGASDD